MVNSRLLSHRVSSRAHTCAVRRKTALAISSLAVPLIRKPEPPSAPFASARTLVGRLSTTSDAIYVFDTDATGVDLFNVEIRSIPLRIRAEKLPIHDCTCYLTTSRMRLSILPSLPHAFVTSVLYFRSVEIRRSPSGSFSRKKELWDVISFFSLKTRAKEYFCSRSIMEGDARVSNYASRYTFIPKLFI